MPVPTTVIFINHGSWILYFLLVWNISGFGCLFHYSINTFNFNISSNLYSIQSCLFVCVCVCMWRKNNSRRTNNNNNNWSASIKSKIIFSSKLSLIKKMVCLFEIKWCSEYKSWTLGFSALSLPDEEFGE